MKANARMTVEKRVEPAHGLGDTPEVWEKIAVQWFELKTTGGGKDPSGNTVDSNETHEGKCVFFQGTTSIMRLLWQGRIYHVVNCQNENEQNRFLIWKLNLVG